MAAEEKERGGGGDRGGEGAGSMLKGERVEDAGE
jgi:hypothetical protein